jgi:hypothetical protein
VHHSRPEFPPKDTALLVVEDVSVLFPPTAPKAGPKGQSTPKTGNTALHSTLLSALNKIAASHNVAVLLSSYVSTRMRQDAGALLVAAQGSKDWDDQLSSRIIVFRDFPPHVTSKQSNKRSSDHAKPLERLRYAGIIKAQGKSTIENDIFHDIVPFSISDVGSLPHDHFWRKTKAKWKQYKDGIIVHVSLLSIPDTALAIQSPTRPGKRRLDELPDSEEEWDDDLEGFGEYDWGDDPSFLSQPNETFINRERDLKKQKLDKLTGKDDIT